MHELPQDVVRGDLQLTCDVPIGTGHLYDVCGLGTGAETGAAAEQLDGEGTRLGPRAYRVARAEVRVGKPKLLDGCTPFVTLRRENPRYLQTWP